MIIEKGCDTCKYFSAIEGGCSKVKVDKFECRIRNTSRCTGYEIAEFYKRLQ